MYQCICIYVYICYTCIGVISFLNRTRSLCGTCVLFVFAGIPVPMPAVVKSLDSTVPHAPKRTTNLNKEQFKVSKTVYVCFLYVVLYFLYSIHSLSVSLSLPSLSLFLLSLSVPNKHQLAIKNALRYFPSKTHATLGREFAQELRTYGHIYMYRFRPRPPFGTNVLCVWIKFIERFLIIFLYFYTNELFLKVK